MTSTFSDAIELSASRLGTSICIGLDAEMSMIPRMLSGSANPILEFNRQVIAATSDIASAYKMNLAFYEADGRRGLDALYGTLDAIPDSVLKIGDAKRGDIPNTARAYAKAMFIEFGFNATTVNPYMGMDTLEPFFTYTNRGVFILALTSNPGSSEFQRQTIGNLPLYIHVIDRALAAFGDSGSIGFVVGATHPDDLAEIRRRIGRTVPLLIPGIGSQGGDVAATLDSNAGGIALFNVSRAIITVDPETADATAEIRSSALKYRDQLLQFANRA